MDQLLVLLRRTSHETRVALVPFRPLTFLSLDHGDYCILHALLDKVIRRNRHLRGVEIAALAVLLEQVPVLELLLQIFDLEVHDDFNGCAHIFEHLEAGDHLELVLFFFQNFIGYLIELY